MSAKQYFIDSNIFVALIDESDVHHNHAKTVLENIESDQGQIFASDVVLNEVLSVIARRCEEKKRSEQFSLFSDQFFRYLKDLPILCLYQLLPKFTHAVVSLMKESAGRLNFHDALIAFFLGEVREVKLVTFDRDFQELKNISLWNKT